jgi:hypothetical protein
MNCDKCKTEMEIDFDMLYCPNNCANDDVKLHYTFGPNMGIGTIYNNIIGWAQKDDAIKNRDRWNVTATVFILKPGKLFKASVSPNSFYSTPSLNLNGETIVIGYVK